MKIVLLWICGCQEEEEAEDDDDDEKKRKWEIKIVRDREVVNVKRAIKLEMINEWGVWNVLSWG